MRFKALSFKNPIFLEDMKRLWGLAVVYFLAVFFTGPFQIFLRIGDPNRSIKYLVESLLNFRGMEIQVFYSIVFSILLSMLLYRYLHTINSTTVIHSLPITRRELFHSHNLAALIFIVMPVVLNALVLIGLMLIYNDGGLLFEEVFTINGILKWMGMTILSNIVIYLASTFIAMITGTSIIQGILSIIFVFLPLGLGSLVLVNLNQLVYGFSLNSSLYEDYLARIIPAVLMIIEPRHEIGWGLLFWYIILSIALYMIALYFYEKRHLEKATDPIAFDGLKPVFKYGVTFCGMVLAGAYFYSLENRDIWLYIGYIIGGYLGYLIGEMITQKTIWVFRNIKGFLIYSIIIIIAFAGIKLDITGFERRIPDLDQIENAYYGYGVYPYRSGDQEGMKDLDNIELVRKLHGQMIENKSEFKSFKNNRDTAMVGIAYRLIDGKTMYREYIVPSQFVRKNPIIKDIYEAEEYKINYHGIFKWDNGTKIDYLEMRAWNQPNKSIIIVDNNEINELIEVVKKDLLEQTYEDSFSNIAPWANISVISRDNKAEHINKELYIYWRKSYDNLSSWLKEKGYYEKVRTMPEDVEYAVVEKRINAEGIVEKPVVETIDMGMGKGKKVEIRNKEKIEILLENFETHHISEGKYLVGFYLKDGSNILGVISEDNLPQEIRDDLK